MSAGPRLLEHQSREAEQKLAALRILASEAFDAFDRGDGETLDDAQALKDHIARIGHRASGHAAIPSE